jgi:hypothetical protein
MERTLEVYQKAVMERICAVCVDRRDDGSCGLDPHLECEVEKHLPALLDVVKGVKSQRIDTYVESLRRNICSVCEQGNADGTCDVRAKVDCTLDRYLALVIEAIEEVDRGESGDQPASAT